MTQPASLDAETKRHCNELLASPVLARLGTASAARLQPHVVPVWFYWDGACLWISGFGSTRKFKELRRNPRCAVLVDGGGPPPDDQPPAWGVLFEGQGELITSPAELVVEMSTRIYIRYLGEKGVLAPEPQSWIHDDENTLIRLAPELIYNW